MDCLSVPWRKVYLSLNELVKRVVLDYLAKGKGTYNRFILFHVWILWVL